MHVAESAESAWVPLALLLCTSDTLCLQKLQNPNPKILRSETEIEAEMSEREEDIDSDAPEEFTSEQVFFYSLLPKIFRS